MRRLLLGTALVAVGGWAAMTASAQDIFRSEGDPTWIRASDFIGKRIYASEGAIDGTEIAGVQDRWNDIGEVNDLLLGRDGTVSAVLLDIGGFLGMGERQVALGMESLRIVNDSATGGDLNDYFLVVQADRAALEGAPAYSSPISAAGGSAEDSSKMTRNADGTQTEAGRQADVEAVENAEGSTEGGISDRETATENAEQGTATGTGTATTDTAMGTGTATGTGTGMSDMQVEGFAAADKAVLTTAELEGVRVYGTNGEDLGEISNFVLGDDGSISQVIVDVGGFLGIGEKPVAIEMAGVNVLRAEGGDEYRAYVRMTRDQLESLPAMR